MKKIRETVSSVKDSFNVELSKLGLEPSLETSIASQEMKTGLNIPVEEEIILKKPIKKGISDKLVGKVKMKTPIGKLYSIGKSESKEATGAGAGVGAYDTPLFTTTKGEMEEKWSQKYKDSVLNDMRKQGYIFEDKIQQEFSIYDSNSSTDKNWIEFK